MTQSAATPSRLRGFFSNPWVGVIGSIASVIGVLLAIYFFVGSRRERELTYFVHPVKSIVVRAGEVSELSVSSRGSEIKSDVTTAQIALWNAGKEPIRAQHVLRPFIIQTEGNTPILEARIRKQSRDVVELQLDQSRIDQGQVRVSWSILERGDGGVVQMILAGGTGVELSASAVIEGQPEVRSIAYTRRILPPIEQYAKNAREDRIWVSLSLSMGVGFVAIALASMFASLKQGARRGIPNRSKWREAWDASKLSLGAAMLFIGMAVLRMFLVSRDPGPPFGF